VDIFAIFAHYTSSFQINISLYQNTDHGVSNRPLFWQKRPRTQLLFITFHFLWDFVNPLSNVRETCPKLHFPLLWSRSIKFRVLAERILNFRYKVRFHIQYSQKLTYHRSVRHLDTHYFCILHEKISSILDRKCLKPATTHHVTMKNFLFQKETEQSVPVAKWNNWQDFH